MQIEREMGAIDSTIGVKKSFDFFVGCSGDRCERFPEHSVVNNKKIDTFFRGFFKRDQTGIDRSADSPDIAAVGKLKAVVGAGKIGDFGTSRAFVAKGNDIGKFCHHSETTRASYLVQPGSD